MSDSHTAETIATAEALVEQSEEQNKKLRELSAHLNRLSDRIEALVPKGETL
jgi:hypothetical protein